MSTPKRAIVEVRLGPLSSRKAILDPGQTLHVGRSNVADLSLPHDEAMSAKHLAITWDGARARVRDLGSLKGTFLHGARVEQADLANGDWIRAGDTNLMVYFEAHTPPDPAPTPDAAAPTMEAALALHLLQHHPGPLFAVVDASRGPRPLRLLREAVDEHRSLYDGRKGESLAGVAPYLVALRPDSGLLERLVLEGWGARWGIFLACARPFKDVRRHLRRFLLVEDDVTGERYFFRFYDPGTLRVFLPACTPRQRADFFGEVACFLAEGKDGELSTFTPEAAS